MGVVADQNIESVGCSVSQVPVIGEKSLHFRASSTYRFPHVFDAGGGSRCIQHPTAVLPEGNEQRHCEHAFSTPGPTSDDDDALVVRLEGISNLAQYTLIRSGRMSSRPFVPQILKVQGFIASSYLDVRVRRWWVKFTRTVANSPLPRIHPPALMRRRQLDRHIVRRSIRQENPVWRCVQRDSQRHQIVDIDPPLPLLDLRQRRDVDRPTKVHQPRCQSLKCKTLVATKVSHTLSNTDSHRTQRPYLLGHARTLCYLSKIDNQNVPLDQIGPNGKACRETRTAGPPIRQRPQATGRSRHDRVLAGRTRMPPATGSGSQQPRGRSGSDNRDESIVSLRSAVIIGLSVVVGLCAGGAAAAAAGLPVTKPMAREPA